MILYRGPSQLDGKPIVAIVTGLDLNSVNAKTGAMAQVWILRDDIAPIDAVKQGEDVSICGQCPHRGISEYVSAELGWVNRGRTCYVTLFHAPRNVWASYKRGVYGDEVAQDAPARLANKKVRLGAYGDPAALPFGVWQAALANAAAFTGYTHQWRSCDTRFRTFVMASADSAADMAEAQTLGYRTFRVRTAAEALAPREVICPASQEAGKKTSCAACLACGGTSAKAKASIAIVAHGAGARNFARAIA
jgi:hypothetical protein